MYKKYNNKPLFQNLLNLRLKKLQQLKHSKISFPKILKLPKLRYLRPKLQSKRLRCPVK